ncbi:winged helix-turn-helix domain-containing protein [Thalassotalea fusca]
MRWQIAQYIFCDQQQFLALHTENDTKTVQLEPMMVELLRYFCQHPDKIVSKETLIEHVWLGRIVSDNAVSKLITKLRKVFNDDPKQPQFIATFPKKGYKFIATVVPASHDEPLTPTEDPSKTNACIDQTHDVLVQQAPLVSAESEQVKTVDTALASTEKKTNSDSENNTPATASNSLRLAAGLISVLMIVLLLFWYNKQAVENIVTLTSAKAITTDAGNELFPAVSPDGTRVAYMLSTGKQMKLIIKRLADQQQIEIQHESGVGVGPANWNTSGDKIVYLVATPQRCQYFIREIDDMSVGEPQLIHNCPAGSYGKILFTHDDNRLVFAEISEGNHGYSMFEINLISQKVKHINQPELVLGGNSQFDLHPTKNRLLISSPDKQQWEGFYSLDLDSNELTLLFKQDAYICCGIWSHDGERVVLMGEHPAYQILSYDLQGNDRQVVYSGSRQLSWPRRHTNGRDYLFASGNHNEDIHAISLADSASRVVADASVDERLVTYSAKRHQIAYISFASGSEEVWISDTNSTSDKPARKLTSFNDSRHYVDLLWSPDGKYLLALMLNEMHLINVESGDYERLKIPQSEIRGVSFKSGSQIAYSIQESNQWQVYLYDINNHSVASVDKRWQFVRFDALLNDTLWLDQTGILFVGKQPTPIAHESISSSNLLSGRQFNLTKRGSDYFWYEYTDGGKIRHLDSDTGIVSTVTHSDSARFALADNTLLYGITQRGSIDIYQTQSVSR